MTWHLRDEQTFMTVMGCNSIVSLAALAISIIAMCLSLYAFIRFDRKIKQQTIDLNERKLRKEREAEYLSKSAHIEVSVLLSIPNGYIMRIKNTGCAIAKEVWVECKPNVLSGGIFHGPKLESSQYAEQPISFGMLTQDWIDVTIKWYDDNGHHKEECSVYRMKDGGIS